ncbi:MAG: hypothetical protein ACRD90_06800 [Nitrosopumilaceae archaeon]
MKKVSLKWKIHMTGRTLTSQAFVFTIKILSNLNITIPTYYLIARNNS